MGVDVWDPERLRNIAWIMGRYSEHLKVDDVIELRIPGDTAQSSFRGVPPQATVTSIHRDEDTGYVSFRARVHDSDVEMELDNRNVSPDRVWNIPEASVETFRSRVEEAKSRGVVNEIQEQLKENLNELRDEIKPKIDEQAQSNADLMQRIRSNATDLEDLRIQTVSTTEDLRKQIETIQQKVDEGETVYGRVGNDWNDVNARISELKRCVLDALTGICANHVEMHPNYKGFCNDFLLKRNEVESFGELNGASNDRDPPPILRGVSESSQGLSQRAYGERVEFRGSIDESSVLSEDPPA